MRQQLYYHLLNDAGVSAIVGAKVYPQRVPSGQALPYVEFTFDGRDASYDQDGYDKWNQVTVQINSASSTLLGAVTLAAAVFSSLDIQDQQLGEVGSQEKLTSTTLETEFDNFDLFDGSEDGVRILTQTYTISYMEN